MATEKEVAMLKNRSDTTGRLPAPPLVLDPLPPEIVKAFPSMAVWHKQNNQKIAEWISKTNTAIGTNG